MFIKIAEYIINKNKVVKVIQIDKHRSRIVLSGIEIKPIEVGLSVDEVFERLTKD